LLELLYSLAVDTSISEAKIFKTVLVEASRLRFDVGGWFQIESYRATEITRDSEGNLSFGLEFELPASVPQSLLQSANETCGHGSAALVTADPIVSASNPAPSLPREAYLRQVSITLSGDGGTVDVYPISLLASWRLLLS